MTDTILDEAEVIEQTPSSVVSDPELFASTFLRIRDKSKELVPLKWNKAQRHFHENRTGRDLILKARQLGFSTYVQGEQYRRLVIETRTTLTLAHDSDTTQKLRRMSDRYWENCRFNDIQPLRQYANAALATYPETDSTSVIGTAGNVQKGRGDTYTDIHGSEVAFWPDAEKILVGAMQGGSPDVILESTPNGAQGHFYQLCMEALGDNSVWTLHFYQWWWDEEYKLPLADGEIIEYSEEEAELADKHGLTPEQIKWRRNKQKELRDKFQQEYPEDVETCFLTSGSSYFGDTSSCFGAPMDPVYDVSHHYSGGLDFAQTTDFLVYSISDRTTNEQVAQLRINNLPWKELRKRVYQMWAKWSWTAEYDKRLERLNLALSNHEISFTVYEANIDKLEAFYKKRKVHTAAEWNSIGSPNIEALEEMGMTIEAFITTNDSKADLMSEQYEALHTRGYQLQNRTSTKHEYNIFVATQLPSMAWRLAAEGEGHDDTVIATALDTFAGTSAKTTRMHSAS